MGIITNKKILDKIEVALKEIRPFLQDDGGDIIFIELTDQWTVKVKLIGACSDCNISMMTLKNGVEVVIKHAVPQVKEVIEISSL
ncbi:MAG: NifU family protein [Flavobacteriales bacterium]|jgi:Fe-S cluster biogenesis protein NfuA|nr:NifU family protein [Flavobacteriales bacterium]MBT5089655.1 NifU family protein [Flavobacteriales bacterium]